MSNIEEARSLYQQALERYGEIRVMLSHAQQELDPSTY